MHTLHSLEPEVVSGSKQQEYGDIDIAGYNYEFPELPTPSPLNQTPPSTLYSGTNDIFMEGNSDKHEREKRKRNSNIDGSNSALSDSDSDEMNFVGFQRNKRNRIGVREKDQYLDDSLSSIHLQLSSSGAHHNYSNSRESTRINSQNNQTNVNTQDLNNNLTSGNNEQLTVDTDATVIIQPSESSRKQFFSSSVKLYRILQNSPFQTANIITSRTNLSKGIQIVTIKNRSKLTELLAITNLGGYEVRCFRSTPWTYKVGLIGPIEMDVNETEIVELLSELGYKNSKAERFVIGKGDSARITKTMKIWLNVNSLPENICLLYRRFAITPFIEKPWQCYKCQSFGHSAKNCSNRDRCVVCAGPHNIKDCEVREGNARKCVNCGENHTASYGGCSKIVQERKIQHVRAFQNLSYSDAAKMVKNKNSNPVIDTDRNRHQNFAPTKNSLEKTIKQTKEMSTQTGSEKPNIIEDITIPKQNNSSNEKLAFCLLDLFMSMMKADSTAKKCALISKAFSEHLSVTVSKEDLMTSFRGTTSRQSTSSPVIQTKANHRKNGQQKI